MPYGQRRYARNYRRGGRSGGGRAWYDKKYSTMQLAKKAWWGVKKIKKLINVEFKNHDINIANTVTVAGVAHTLTGIAQGDTQGTRDGNSVLGQKLELKIQYNQDSEADTSIIRTIIVRDKQQQADTAPTLTEILDQDLTTVLTRPYSSESPKRFSILHDSMLTLNKETKTVAIKTIKLKCNQHVLFNGTAAGDIQKNGIYLFFLTNEDTNEPTVLGMSRLTYTDN